ncbi:hypothetical protein V7S43_018987 [Phytophthora oleae]|uniref:Uncharacterized protein n=1 Tax=Phytophthora oleae TaxID=2107226 RepID=A0ABD3ESG7_9STRA
MTTQYAEYQTFHVQSALDDLNHDVMVYGLGYIGGAIVVFVPEFRVQNIGFFDEKKNAPEHSLLIYRRMRRKWL